MSKFFKALQQAEQERALRAEPGPPRDWVGEAAAETEHPAPGREVGSVRDAEDARSAQSVHRVEDWPSEVRGIEGIEEHLVSVVRPSSFEAEQYRALSHLMERVREIEAVKVVGIASPGGGDGKTVTAVNLVGALAQNPRSRTLLIEADLRRPMIADYLGIPDSDRGLVQAVATPGRPLADFVTGVRGLNFDVLVAGHPSTTPYEMLRSARVEEIFQEARQAYDYVVVDTPPLVAMPESRVIERLVDGILVVVRAHRTLRSLLEEALRAADGTKILGLVFNEDDQLLPNVDRYYRYRGREASRNGRAG